MQSFIQRLKGAIYGTAIGDGMGAPVEGWSPERIAERFADHDFSTFLPPTHGGDPAGGKGDGRITDDTLMVEALIKAYGSCGTHMDAYAFRDMFVPEFAERPVWIPERRKECALIERLNPIEKYTVTRLKRFQAYPRHAGIGNAVNCGAAMYIMPVGAVNAADPHRAFQEAVSLAMAETDSYAVEAAGVLAACYAVALDGSATIESICDCAHSVARDGTAAALKAVLPAAEPDDTVDAFIEKTRRAFLPFDPTVKRGGVAPVHEPSRSLSIEEVPIALAALKYGAGDFLKTLAAAVRYGRDCDSIAGMACGLAGAVFGCETLPAGLRTECDRANQRDFGALASAFTQTVHAIWRKDAEVSDTRRQWVGDTPPIDCST
ncbi:MAG: ADP-ribosylglycohydrolase family protein [Planctomycetes bacterium]|nr:ADP-ribosylglycohydrolase family protein [Planctomycetota bacterium]